MRILLGKLPKTDPWDSRKQSPDTLHKTNENITGTTSCIRVEKYRGMVYN